MALSSKSALIEAIKKGAVEEVKELVDSGVYINVTSDWIIEYVITRTPPQNTEFFLKILLDANANVNSRNCLGFGAIVSSVCYPHRITEKFMRMLLAAGADTNMRSKVLKRSALMNLFWDRFSNSTKNVTKMLLETDVDGYAKNCDGLTALVYLVKICEIRSICVVNSCIITMLIENTV